MEYYDKRLRVEKFSSLYSDTQPLSSTGYYNNMKFENKRYATLTNTRLMNHLCGKEIIGIYPLLQDNTSWFIAADFDETISKNKNWITECRRFIGECEKHLLPVYLERSRSGQAGMFGYFLKTHTRR